jgi:DNA-binding NarL/FixJ family response regulator
MSKQIFIVDDSELVRKYVRTHLESHLEQITCAEANDGLEAIQRVRDVAPDLVILDLCMPVMNGLDTAAALHDVFPKLPIILYTLHKDVVTRTQAQSFGVRAVISKSDQIELLVEEISKSVGVAKTASA